MVRRAFAGAVTAGLILTAGACSGGETPSAASNKPTKACTDKAFEQARQGESLAREGKFDAAAGLGRAAIGHKDRNGNYCLNFYWSSYYRTLVADPQGVATALEAIDRVEASPSVDTVRASQQTLAELPRRATFEQYQDPLERAVERATEVVANQAVANGDFSEANTMAGLTNDQGLYTVDEMYDRIEFSITKAAENAALLGHPAQAHELANMIDDTGSWTRDEAQARVERILHPTSTGSNGS
jgi:hypothetical protein